MVEELVIGSRDGTRLAARRSGSGTPLVLVHGGVVDKDAAAFVELQLAEQHEVWTFDRRGHGASGDADDHAVEREIEDLAAVRSVAGSQVHLVGHSDGARLCLEAAVHLPPLRSLVLYEPAVHFDRRQGAFGRALEMLVAGDVEAFLHVFLAEIAAASDDELTMLRSAPEAWSMLVKGAKRYATNSDVFARRVDDLVARGWRPGNLRSVAAPTLLITGELTRSPLFLTADELHEAVPHAEAATIEGQGHLAAAFAPERLARVVLAFTARHDG